MGGPHWKGRDEGESEMKKTGKKTDGSKDNWGAPRFEEGNPGGPGRPKGSRNFKTIATEYLRMQRKNFEKMNPQDQLMYENIVAGAIRRAVNRGGSDLMVILDRVEGAVDQNVNINGQLEGLTDAERDALEKIAIARRTRGKI